MMNVLLLLGTILLAGAMAPVTTACSVKPGCSSNANSPPPLPTKHQALLHSRCYSACLRLVINKKHVKNPTDLFLHGKCSSVQAVDECKAGCVEGSHRHNNTPSANHCTKKCSTICKKESTIKWAGYHGLPNCTRDCNVPNCVTGCMMTIKHHHPAIGPSLLPPALVHKSGKNSTIYSVKSSKSLEAATKWHKNALHHSALVLRVDVNSNSSHYYWLPKLDIELDLGHFACQAVNVSVMAVNGNKTTHFTHPITKCIHKAPRGADRKSSNCRSGNFRQLVNRLSQVEKKLNKVLAALSSSHDKKFEKELKNFDTKINEVLKKISKKKN